MMEWLDKLASLTPLAKMVVCDKATEYPHSGAYNQLKTKGTYLCRRCGLALFRGVSQFSATCGWPSFDEEIGNAVKKEMDADGRRVEILCQRCQAHLGHIFEGEGFTGKNKRYCVNSVSLDFVENSQVLNSEEAVVAGGCFWGVEYFLKQLPGVLRTEVGYIGGELPNPTYKEVCSGQTGHYEALRVLFDPAKLDYYQVLQRFFEIHDPTQKNGQGPDIGLQYQSAVFYFNEEQWQDASDLIRLLHQQGYEAVTRLLPMSTFWPAEAYHQNYYDKQQKLPYCHRPVARFK